VVNHLEKIIVTSDCATIVKELEVAHPAAKILTLAAEMQEQEYGDFTNFVRYFPTSRWSRTTTRTYPGLNPFPRRLFLLLANC
jgi:T-complex protein 1 subunit theta